MIFQSLLPIIFFIPGYYGSHLRDVQKDQQIFLGARNLTPGRPLEKLDAKEYQADIMESVQIGPFSKPIYGPVLDTLRKRFGRDRVIPFGYDWRAPLDQSADKLNLFIEKSWDKKSPIVILAHSMGGLLVSHLWQKANTAQSLWLKNLKHVGIIASPLKGSPPILRNLTIGTPFPYNSSLLLPENLWTYATPFHLLPESIPALDGKSEKMLATADPEFWKRYVLPRLSFSVDDQLLEKKISHITGTRAAVTEFFSAEHSFQLKVVVAENQKTPARFYLDKNSLVFDYYRLLGFMFQKRDEAYYAPGDGTVTTESQLPPGIFPSAKQSSLTGNTVTASGSASAKSLGSPSRNLSIIELKADHMEVLEQDEALSF